MRATFWNWQWEQQWKFPSHMQCCTDHDHDYNHDHDEHCNDDQHDNNYNQRGNLLFCGWYNCGQGLESVSPEVRKAAVDALAITYKRESMKGRWTHTPPGCFVHKGCTQGCRLHFGTGNGSNNGKFPAICNVAQALPLFAFSESGVVDGCPADYAGIFEVAACKEAATYLGSGDRLTSSSISSVYADCYYNHKYAYFNMHPSPDGSFHEEQAGQICMLEALSATSFVHCNK